MWKLTAAAALAAGALLGSTAQPAADAPDRRAAAGLPHNRLVLGLDPPERVAVVDVRTGHSRNAGCRAAPSAMDR